MISENVSEIFEIFGEGTPRRLKQLFGNDSPRQRDQFSPKIVEIGTTLAIFRPFEVVQPKKSLSWAVNHKGKITRKLFSLRESRRGGDELRTHVYLTNLAPIAAKIRENAFQMICNFRFFDAEKKIDFFFRIFFSVFLDFRQILEELGSFGRQNQIPRGISLLVVKFSGVQDAWST